MKRPAFQFYPGDWRKDPNLSRATLAAKGALIEILCLAFESEKRGVLVTGKTPWTKEEIAYAIGGDLKENLQAIEELLNKKILKIDKKGAIYSARMVRDEELSKVRRSAGFKGGNPILLNQKVNQPSNQNTTPSSSSSSSSSTSKEVVVAAPDPWFYAFRRCAGPHITDNELKTEIGKFHNRYPNHHLNQSGALINTWVSNIGQRREKPKQSIVV